MNSKMVMKVIFIMLLMLYANCNKNYASEKVELELSKQIDLKSNVEDGEYGKYDHYVSTYTRIQIENVLIASGSIQDYPNYSGFLKLYDLNKNICKTHKLPYESTYMIKAKMDEYTKDIIVVGVREIQDMNYIFVMVINKELNIIYNATLYNTNGDSFDNVSSIALGISESFYNIAYVDYTRNIKYFKIDKKSKNIEYNFIQRDSSKNVTTLLTHPNGSIWGKYRYTNKSKNEKYVMLEKVKNVRLLRNFWPYSDNEIFIEGIVKLSDKNVLIYGGKKYAIIDNNNELKKYGELSDLQEYEKDLILNRTVERDKYINIDEKVEVKIFNDTIYTRRNGEDVDNEYIGNAQRILEETNEISEGITYKNGDNYYMIDKKGNIFILTTSKNVLSFSNDRVITSTATTYEKKTNEFLEVNNTKEAMNVIVTNAPKSSEMYVGNNGLCIEGIVKGDRNFKGIVKMTIGGVTKSQRIELAQSNNFKLCWKAEELIECKYTNLKINLLEDDNEYCLYADNLKLGDVICTNNKKYIKISDGKYLELYSENPNAYRYSDIADDEWKKFMTQEEYENVKNIINQNEGLYRYWLSNKNVVNSNSTINNSPGKSAYSYTRKVIKVDINKKFKYNQEDKTYYECRNVENKSFDLNFDIEVSKRTPESPVVTIMPEESDKYISKNVIIKVDTVDSEAKTVCIINHDGNITKDVYNREINLEYSGIYKCEFFNTYENGNESAKIEKVIKIDKDAPIIESCEYKNSYDGWIKNAQGVLIINIVEAHSGLSNETIEKYSASQISSQKYAITKKVSVNENTNLILEDLVGNRAEYNFENNMKIDDETPNFIEEKVDEYDEKIEIILKAIDSKSGIKNIFYRINNDEWNEYDKSISLERCKYDRNTLVEYYAEDNVGNQTNVHSKKINLNDIPIVEMLNENDLKNEYNLSERVRYKFKISDKDENDEMRIIVNATYIDIDGNLNKKILLEKITNSEENFDLQIENYIMKELQYENNVIIDIMVTDGLEKTAYKHVFQKINMKPTIKIDNYIDKMFENFLEFDIYIEDYDEEIIKLKISTFDGKILYEKEVKKGFNKIILSKVLPLGKNDIILTVADGKEKTFLKTNVEILKELKLQNEDICIIQLKNKHSTQYYNMIYEKVKDVSNVLLIIKNEFEHNKEQIESSNLVYSLSEKQDMNDDVCKGYICGEINEIDINRYIRKVKYKDTKKVYEKGEYININDFEFYDEEEDYYEEKHGDKRKIQIYHDTYEFENDNGLIEQNGKYDYELNKWNEELYQEYDKYKFDNKKTITEYSKLNFKLDRIGRYIMNIKEKDYIVDDKIDYSLYSDDNNYEFYVHRKPVISLNYEYVDDNHIRIIKSSYDLDFYSQNKGIKEEKVTKLERDYSGNIISTENIYDENYVEINDAYITEIKYEVCDYGISKTVDNEYTLTNQETIEINKYNCDITCDFEYIIGDKNANGYVYAGNYGHERVKFKDYINMNNKNLIKEKSYYVEEKEFNEKIKNNDGSLNTEYSNTLSVKDIYDKVTISKERKIIKKEIFVNNISSDNYTDEKRGFDRNKEIKIKIELSNINDDEIILLCNDIEMQKDKNNIYTYVIDKNEIQNEYIEYEIIAKSRRDDTIIAAYDYKDNVYDDVSLYEFNVIDVADPIIKNEIGNNHRYVCSLPIGKEDEYKPKKGYAFEFLLSSKGLEEDDDYIVIKPTVYHFDNKDRNKVKIVKKSHDGTYKQYDSKIILNEKVIGTDKQITLGKEQRKIKTDSQEWHGKYFIPLDASILKNNKIINDGYLIINFQIEGYKNGIRRFIYVPDTWKEEKDGMCNNYELGDVIIYNNGKTINDDLDEMSLY